MKKMQKLVAGVAVAGLALVLGTGSALAYGGSMAERGVCADPLVEPVVAELSAEETAGLLKMREEEKLAHDVYLVLGEQWNLPLFGNIAASEQSHADAVLATLTRYQVADPAADLGVGVFVDPELQALYDRLVMQGSESLIEALRVGATIEEIDILDLQAALLLTDQADVTQMYQNLLRGSENHLRSFVSTLAGEGVTYAPQFMSEAAFQAIMNGTTGNGPGGAGSSAGGGGGAMGRGRGGR